MTFILRAPRDRRLTASFGLSLTAAGIAIATLAATVSTPLSALARPPKRHSSSSIKRVHKAMVRVETARLRSSPGNQHAPTALLDAGRPAAVIARKGEWAKLRLATGREGWVRADLLSISKKTVKLASAGSKPKKAIGKPAPKVPKNQVKVALRPVKRVAVAKPAAAKHAAALKRAAALKHAIALKRIAAAKHVAALKRGAALKRVAAAKPIYKKPAPIKTAAARPAVRKTYLTAAAAKPARFTFSRPIIRSPRFNPQISAPTVGNTNSAASESTASAVVPAISEASTANTPMRMVAQSPNSAGTTGTVSDAVAPVQVAMVLPNAERMAAPVSAAPPKQAVPINRNLNRNERIARSALSYRGVPYRMGATGRGAFDCSGFMMYLFDKEGLDLPRTAAQQYRKGTPIPRNQLKPGDLVFFKNTYKRGVSHVGIYIGGGKFCHASSGGHAVRTDSLSKGYYLNHWAGARRPR